MNWMGQILPTVQQKPTNFSKLWETNCLPQDFLVLHRLVLQIPCFKQDLRKLSDILVISQFIQIDLIKSEAQVRNFELNMMILGFY